MLLPATGFTVISDTVPEHAYAGPVKVPVTMPGGPLVTVTVKDAQLVLPQASSMRA